MPFIIIARDRPDGLELRQRVRPEHLAYLDAHKARLLAAGALLEDDGKAGFGSVLIYDSDDRAEAEAFARGDPFARAGLFASTEIHRWRKGYFDGVQVG